MIPSYPRLRLLLRGDAAARFVFSDAGFWLDGAARTLNVHGGPSAPPAPPEPPLDQYVEGPIPSRPTNSPLGLAPRGEFWSHGHTPLTVGAGGSTDDDESTSGGVCRVAVSRDPRAGPWRAPWRSCATVGRPTSPRPNPSGRI